MTQRDGARGRAALGREFRGTRSALWARGATAFLAAAVLAPAPGSADEPPAAPHRPKVALVLGGGGARGAAHIGVIEVLERHHIPVDLVAGTSMGAIVGGLYATGRSPEELTEILTRIDWADIFADRSPRRDLAFRRKQDDRDFPAKIRLGFEDWRIRLPRGLIQGQKLKRTLDQLTLPAAGVRDFDDLALPFRAVATDITTGEPVVLGHGSLADAIRASMSIPAAFEPVVIDGRLLVDGGISMNVPVDVARQLGADVVIAVDVSTPPLGRDQLTSAVSISGQMITLLMQVRTEQQLEKLTQRDVYIAPQLQGISAADFGEAVEAVSRGVEAAVGQLPELDRYAVSDEEWTAWLARQRRAPAEAPVIAAVRIDNESDVSDDVIRHQIHQRLGQPLDVELLERDLSRLYGFDVFGLVDFSLDEGRGGSTLVIRATPFPLGRNRIRFGINLDTDFTSSSRWDVGVQLTRLPLTSNMGELRLQGGVGSQSSVLAEWFQPLDDEYRWFVAPGGSVGFRDLKLFVGGQSLAEFGVRVGVGQISVGRQLGNWGELRGGLFLGSNDGDLKSAQTIVVDGTTLTLPSRIESIIGGWFARFAVDTLDNTYFPTRGGVLSLQVTGNETALLSDFTSTSVESNGLLALSHGLNTLALGFEVDAPLNNFDNLDLNQIQSLGGFLRLSGLRRDQLFGPYLLLGRAIVYRRIADPRIFSLGLPVYLGASLETGNTYSDSSQITAASLLWSGSGFLGLETPLGPLFFGYGYTEGGNNAVFLSLGRLF